MAAYIIGRINVTDPVAYEDYRKLVPGILAQYGGKFIVRGGKSEILEGDANASLRTVILEFASMEDARKWYNSEEYTLAKALRQQASEGSLILVEGV